MGALRVTFERRELPEVGTECREVGQIGHNANLLEKLCTFNFDFPEALMDHNQWLSVGRQLTREEQGSRFSTSGKTK